MQDAELSIAMPGRLAKRLDAVLKAVPPGLLWTAASAMASQGVPSAILDLKGFLPRPNHRYGMLPPIDISAEVLHRINAVLRKGPLSRSTTKRQAFAEAIVECEQAGLGPRSRDILALGVNGSGQPRLDVPSLTGSKVAFNNQPYQAMGYFQEEVKEGLARWADALKTAAGRKLPEEEVKAVSDRGALDRAGIPSGTQQLLQAAFRNSWFVVDTKQEIVQATQRGTTPGSPPADLLYQFVSVVFNALSRRAPSGFWAGGSWLTAGRTSRCRSPGWMTLLSYSAGPGCFLAMHLESRQPGAPTYGHHRCVSQFRGRQDGSDTRLGRQGRTGSAPGYLCRCRWGIGRAAPGG